MDEQALKQIASQLRKPQGEEGIKTGEWMNKGNLRINHDTLKVLQASGEEHILEIGMGNGFFVKNILEDHPQLKYTGCDFSDVMIGQANKINAEWVIKGQATFINADISSLPFQNETFDTLFTINTIYFWENEVAILNELKRVLKPNGKLIITLRPKRQMINYPFTKYGFNMFSKEDLIGLLATNGFVVSEVFENQEPDFELNGEMKKMENLIVIANKKI